MTTSKFDPETGLFTFKSTDIMTFWSQTITFEIFATSGESEESFTFDLKLVNPCQIATFEISREIIDETIDYNVYRQSSAQVIQLDKELVRVRPESDLCPDIELSLANIDGSKITDQMFTYEAETH